MIGKEEIKEWLDRIEEEDPIREERGPRPVPDFEEIHVDDAILVVAKRAGLSVIPERDPELPNLRKVAGRKYRHLLTVHRIDRGTSGLVLFARTEDAHAELNRMFRDREVEKRYLAVVDGEAPEETFEVDIPLADGPRGTSKPSADGKESLTKFSVLERFRGFTLLEAAPVTGRRHQIRVHAALSGLPLTVDDRYGSRESFFLSSIKRRYRTGKGKQERPLIDRLTLHARTLAFTHPVSGEQVSFEAEEPRDFRALLKQLRKLRSIADSDE